MGFLKPLNISEEQSLFLEAMANSERKGKLIIIDKLLEYFKDDKFAYYKRTDLLKALHALKREVKK